MRRVSTLLVFASLLLAGCLGDDNEEPIDQGTVDDTPADASDGTTGTPSGDDGVAGICVIGVESPCNAPQWEDPCVAPAQPATGASVAWSGPADLGPGDALTLKLQVPAHRAGDVTAVTWRVNDAVVGNGTELTHTWDAIGSHAVTVHAKDECDRTIVTDTFRIGVALNKTWQNTIIVGDGYLCLAPPYTCGNHSIDLPPAATTLRVNLDRPDAPVGDGLVVTLTDPRGTDAGTGTTFLVDAPTFGTWNLTVHGHDATASYTLHATASFPDDRDTMTRLQGT